MHWPKDVYTTFRTVDKHLKQMFFFMGLLWEEVVDNIHKRAIYSKKDILKPYQWNITRLKVQNNEFANWISNPTNCRLKTNLVIQTPFKVATPPTRLPTKVTTTLKKCYQDFSNDILYSTNTITLSLHIGKAILPVVDGEKY